MVALAFSLGSRSAARLLQATDTEPVISYDAVVLAGGDARRLGGGDKPMTAISGTPMLVRVLGAVSSARSVVVVGPHRDLVAYVDRVRWTRENPPGGGPVAALAAGLEAVPDPSPITMVLAADLPFVATAVQPLLDAATSAPIDGAILVDADGRDQPLAAAYRRDALVRHLAALGSGRGAAVRDLVRSMQLVRIAGDDAALDCDTWDDVRRAERLASGRQE
jgi:molybdopterin-guanine dinucleotide biosynthesis protein A